MYVYCVSWPMSPHCWIRIFASSTLVRFFIALCFHHWIVSSSSVTKTFSKFIIRTSNHHIIEMRQPLCGFQIRRITVIWRVPNGKTTINRLSWLNFLRVSPIFFNHFFSNNNSHFKPLLNKNAPATLRNWKPQKNSYLANSKPKNNNKSTSMTKI